MRKTITLLIALLALTVSSWAQTQIGPINGFYYEIDGSGNATLIQDPNSGSESSYDYSVAHDALVIPATVSDGLNDYPVKSVGQRAFMQCNAITSVVIEEGVESIGDNAFYGCQFLSTVTLPSTITSLGIQAFASIGNGAYTHDDIQTTFAIYAATPPSYNILFDGCAALVHIYVPAADIESYKAANGWSNHTSIIEALPTIEWNQSDLSNVSVSAMSDDYLNDNQDPIKGIKVTAYSPTSSDYADFSYGNIYIHDNGIVTFAPSFGKLQRIVISCDPEGYSSKDLEHLATGTGWSWDGSTMKLTWKGDATSVDLTCDGSSSGIYVGDIISVEFDYEYEEPATPTSVIWEASDINFYINWDHGSAGNHSNTLKNITITADGGNDDYSQFGNGYSDVRSLIVQDNATLTFSSSLGDFKSIVISYNPLYMAELDDLGAGWTVNNHQLTWTGDASSVVLATNGNSSSNIYLEQITSVVFYFDTPPASVPTTTIKWEGSDLTGIDLYSSASETVNTIKVATKAPLSGDYSHFMTYDGNTSFSINNGGTVTFSPTSGQLTSIVIETNSTQYGLDDLAAGSEWTYNDHILVWSGSASSVTLAVNGASGSVSCHNIQSIEFTVADVPVANSTITWEERQVSHVSLYANEVGNTQKAPLIKNIFVSLTRESEGYGTSCQFTEKYLAIDNCGELKFQSVAGDIQGIVINGSNTYADNLSADWTYDDVAKTLTWAGTASDEVTLSGTIYFDISSIEFTYTPASAPRLGEIINGFYEITGAHTAKVFTAAGSIPDYIEDDEVTYYITEIGDYAYYNDPTEGYFYFGANIAKVGAHAFEGCSRAIEFTFYSTVLDEIGDEAFKNCKLLGWLNFDTQMPPVLGSNAFSGDGFLNHINVYPSSVMDDYKAAAGWSTYADKITLSYPFPATVGEQFFFDNQTTTNIYAVSSVSPKEIKVMPYTAEVNALYPITRTGTLVIPEEAAYLNTGFSVTGIGANAYKDSARFDVVMIPQAVKSIEAGAFLNCTGVENVFFLWNDPTTVTWYDGDKGLEFKTATNGGTKIFVPEGTLAAYQEWAPAWAGCMYEGGILEVDATAGQDPDKTTRYYRTFFDSSKDYMMPPSVWAYVGYVRNDEFILHPIAFDGEIVPAGTAVVLESETPTYSLIAMDPAVPSYTGTNDLIGSDVAFPRADLGEDADKVYVLGKSATIGTDHLIGMGLYRYVGETLGAHKAYMVLDNVPPVPESGEQNAPIRFLFQHEAETTGIENASAKIGGSEKILRDGQLIIIRGDKEYNAQGQIVK